MGGRKLRGRLFVEGGGGGGAYFKFRTTGGGSQYSRGTLFEDFSHSIRQAAYLYLQ